MLMVENLTHRCSGSIDNEMSIHYCSQYNRSPMWWLMEAEYDYDWQTWYMHPIIPIKYCPFCGELLINEE